MKQRKLMLGMIVLVVLHTACATISTDKPQPKIADNYLSAGRDLEERGDLPAALEQYELALTVDPENAVARENRERLSQKLIQMADEHYQMGMKYHGQGKYGLARTEFLTALKFHPEHSEAYQMLVNRQPEKIPPDGLPAYVFHVVKAGESLSIIAKQYYGDFRKFEAIAKFNNIPDATMVQPGQRIMIPKIEGVDLAAGKPTQQDDETAYVEHILRAGESISKLAQLFYGDYKQFHIIAQFNGMEDATRVTAGQKIKIPKMPGLPFYPDAARTGAAQASSSSVPEEKAPEAAPVAQPTSGDEQILAYREAGMTLFRQGKYKDAIFELNKAVEASPKDSETRRYIALAYFESGKQFFNQQDFKAAQDSFEISRQFDPKCDQCQTYIENCKTGPLLLHRSKGLDHFNKSEFKQAVSEFEQFLEAKPQDREVRAYLSKSFYQLGLGDYNKGDFLEAKKGFESALEYDSACEKCTVYIDQSEKSFKETHYNKGIVHFGKEQLPQAIAEWEAVHKIDPNYKDVDQNLKKAKLLQKKLEKIKKAADGNS
ncbi:MAG: LysM peptidoglycan-binding domain-containing protein [Desulfobacteraceae bacterium]|nr:MAG: LysM peptidoglycan-binding domain-containing protein [Desulfobacteraceae bacterium]